MPNPLFIPLFIRIEIIPFDELGTTTVTRMSKDGCVSNLNISVHEANARACCVEQAKRVIQHMIEQLNACGILHPRGLCNTAHVMGARLEDVTAVFTALDPLGVAVQLVYDTVGHMVLRGAAPKWLNDNGVFYDHSRLSRSLIAKVVLSKAISMAHAFDKAPTVAPTGPVAPPVAPAGPVAPPVAPAGQVAPPVAPRVQCVKQRSSERLAKKKLVQPGVKKRSSGRLAKNKVDG